MHGTVDYQFVVRSSRPPIYPYSQPWHGERTDGWVYRRSRVVGLVGILRCACKDNNKGQRHHARPCRGGALSRLCIRSAAPRKRREELDARSLRPSHTSPINATITVTSIPVNELTFFFLQLPSEWTDQFASGIQACSDQFHRCCLNQCLFIFVFANNPYVTMCADHSGDPSRAWPPAAGLLQDCECQLKAPPVSLFYFPLSFCPRTSTFQRLTEA
jgi:hypothetical protein